MTDFLLDSTISFINESWRRVLERPFIFICIEWNPQVTYFDRVILIAYTEDQGVFLRILHYRRKYFLIAFDTEKQLEIHCYLL